MWAFLRNKDQPSIVPITQTQESPPFAGGLSFKPTNRGSNYFFPLPDFDCCPPLEDDSRLGWFCVPDFELLLLLPLP
jgi:hypothetical protein